MFDLVAAFLPFSLTILAVWIALWVANWVLIRRQPDMGNERMFPRQLTMLGLTLLGILIVVLVMPINDSSRNQLIGLFGIVISAVVAFSSTTIISNLMAGVLLRITKPFRVGDFIRVGEHFGRVAERGLFDTEIQTEKRELIALPNTFCITHPLTTIRSSGTIISASLSLGYDLDHHRIETLLLEAAGNSGLTEPFVHIVELGNFAVTYRVSGFLEDTKRILSMQSNLFGCVLDTLHSQGVEIMSPTYMNQRQIGDDTSVVPVTTMPSVSAGPQTSAEDIAFDKAEQAEKLENEKLDLKQEIDSLESELKAISDENRKKSQQEIIATKRAALKALDQAATTTAGTAVGTTTGVATESLTDPTTGQS